MKLCGIYKIQSQRKPNRCYIGSSVNIGRRWADHLKDLRHNKHHSQKLQRHYNKYGEGDLQFSIIVGCDREIIYLQEQFYIDIYNPYFNICKSARGCQGRVLSAETKAKISLSHIGIKSTSEAVEKIRLANLGRKNPHTKDWNKKISDAQRGRKFTDKHKESISRAKKGKSPWNKGKKTNQIPWNKGVVGMQSNPRKGKIKINGQYVYPN